MAVNTKTLNQMLYDQLYGVGFNPVSLNTKGQPTEDAKEADVFRFVAKDKQGKQIGTGWFTIDNGKLTLFADPDFIKNPNIEEFTTFMKNWARHKRLSWEIKNRQDLVPQMTKRKVMKEKEQLGEGYYPMGKKASYNDSVPQVKILIQHTRQIEEGEQRFRNIEKIFVENVNGEKFLLPTNRPGLARVYARHVAEGGTPYDEKGKHITSLVEEYTKMAGFVRATRNGQFNESALRLVNEATSHYHNLRETLTRMTSHRGYNKYFESYTPVLNEETDDETSLNELFVQETLDPRIESVMPILKRLSKNITEMSEVNELAEWAETITEVEDETTKTLAEPAKDMLDELSVATLKSTQHSAGERAEMFKKEIERLKKAGDNENIAKYEKAYKHYQELAKKTTSHPEKMKTISTAKKLSSMMPAKLKNIDEAPGAETLKHNQDTEKSNLKAFDLDEGDVEEGIKDVMKKVRKKFRQSAIGRAREYGYSIEEGFSPSEEVADQIVDSLGGESNLTSDDVYRAVEEFQSMMDSPYKLDTDEVVQIVMDRMNIKDELNEFLGAALASHVVPKIIDKLDTEKNDKEKVNEMLPAIAAGARVAIPLLTRLGPKLASIFKSGAKAAGKGSAKVAKGAADVAAKNAPAVGVGLGVYNAITDTAEKAVGGVGEVYTDVKDAASAITDKVGDSIDAKSVFELASMAVKFALPIGIVLGILYGGKKLIDQVMAESSDDSLNELEDWQKEHNEKEMTRMKELAFTAKPFDEGLDKNQKRAGQLGPTEPVGKNEKNLRGKLVGASESVEMDRLKALSGIK